MPLLSARARRRAGDMDLEKLGFCKLTGVVGLLPAEKMGNILGEVAKPEKKPTSIERQDRAQGIIPC